MRKALVALVAALVYLLVPYSAWTVEAMWTVSTVMTIQLSMPRAGEHLPVTAQLTTAAGVPVVDAQVIFRVGDDYDGLARTDADGRAVWRLRRELPAGTYQIVAVFNGQRHPLLGPSHAYAQFSVGPTTLDVRVDPSRANASRRILAVARLTDAAGAPVANARITLFMNSAREGELFTDDGGMAILPIQRELAAGTYRIEGVFDGLPGFLASRGSTQFAVAATRLTVQTEAPQSAAQRDSVVVARLADATGAPRAKARIVFLVDGTREGEARTDAAGEASRRIQRVLSPGKHTVEAVFEGQPELLPSRASMHLAVAATRLTVQFDPKLSQGGLRAPIVARLADAAGAPVAKARITFFVEGARDGEAFTGHDGVAVWWIKRDLPSGKYTVEGVFEGLPKLEAARASTSVAVAPTTIELRTAVASSRVGQPATVIARLVDAAGAPAQNARIALFVNGVRRGEIRTDANGIASRRFEGDLPTGTYTVEGVFNGLPGLLPSRTSTPLIIEPAVVEIQTVPALAGVRFALDGRAFVSDSDGIVKIPVDRVGDYKLEVLPWDGDKSGIHAEFDRWADPTFVATRMIKVPTRARLTAGFNVSYLISQEFVDPAGHPIDPKRISSFALTSSYGTRYFFDNVQTRWLPGIHVVRLKEGLAESQITYSLDSVIIDGSEVVNRAQQRFTARLGQQWQLQLQLYSVRFVARDALFGFPIGSAIHLTYPDGQSRMRQLGPNGDVRIDGLARGAYTVRIDAPGVAGVTPTALSHDQDVVLLVLSYLDLGVVGLFLAAIGLGLLLLGQPWLRMIARDPLAPLRSGAEGWQRVLVWLRDIPARLWKRGARASNTAEQPGASTDDATDAARPRLRLRGWLLDPALLFACILIAFGALGAVMARSVVASTQAVAAQPDRSAGDAPGSRASKQPVAAPTTMPTSPPAATPTVVPTTMPTSQPAATPRPAPPVSASRTVLAFSQNLERKSNGPEVVRLQQRLRELGYFTYPENTGYFGDDTARALAQFQAQHGLAPTGIADRGTIEAINRCGEDCIGPASGAEDQ